MPAGAAELTLRDARKEFFMNKEKKVFIKDLIVLWLSLSALVCAALNLHVSLNMLGQKEEP